jgi:hypothetical protein
MKSTNPNAVCKQDLYGRWVSLPNTRMKLEYPEYNHLELNGQPWKEPLGFQGGHLVLVLRCSGSLEVFADDGMDRPAAWWQKKDTYMVPYYSDYGDGEEKHYLPIYFEKLQLEHFQGTWTLSANGQEIELSAKSSYATLFQRLPARAFTAKAFKNNQWFKHDTAADLLDRFHHVRGPFLLLTLQKFSLALPKQQSTQGSYTLRLPPELIALILFYAREVEGHSAPPPNPRRTWQEALSD